MRELVETGRRSGRTTTLLLTMLEEMEMHEKPVYLVVGRYCLGHHIKDCLRKLNADTPRVRVVALESLHTLRGANPMDIYIEHTAYEMSNAWQLRDLYMLEDRKYEYVYGA